MSRTVTTRSGSRSPGALEDGGHEAAGTGGPAFGRQRHAGGPLRAHADAQKRAEYQQEHEGGGEAGDEVACRYHRIEIISGARRPNRSAIQPEAIAPTKRISMVRVPTKTTKVRSALNSLAIETISTRKTVKSNASSVQPSQAATNAYHWSLVGSLHQGPVSRALAAFDIVKTSFPCNCPLVWLGIRQSGGVWGCWQMVFGGGVRLPARTLPRPRVGDSPSRTASDCAPAGEVPDAPRWCGEPGVACLRF